MIMANDKEKNGVFGKAKEIFDDLSKADRVKDSLNATEKSKREKELERQRSANIEMQRDAGHFKDDK